MGSGALWGQKGLLARGAAEGSVSRAGRAALSTPEQQLLREEISDSITKVGRPTRRDAAAYA